jgi:tetratricopeptide (TPR) repeat protein
MEPTNPHAINWLGYTYERKGEYKEAMEQWAKLAKSRGHDDYANEMMLAFEKSGYRGFLKQDARHSEAQHDFSSAAADYAMLGDKDAAFAALEKAFSHRADILFIKVDPQFDNLHSDPRYADLLRRMGLPR